MLRTSWNVRGLPVQLATVCAACAVASVGPSSSGSIIARRGGGPGGESSLGGGHEERRPISVTSIAHELLVKLDDTMTPDPRRELSSHVPTTKRRSRSRTDMLIRVVYAATLEEGVLDYRVQ